MKLFGIEIVFVVKTQTMVNIFRKYFQNLLNIDIIKCDISQIKADCIVCPGDSYGLMDTGVSYRINQILQVSNAIKNTIESLYYGEQPVGTCILLPTNNNKYKYVAHLPLMRESTDISKSYNVYTAFRAMLTTVLNHNKYCDLQKIPDKKIKIILCTPLGTSLGMDPDGVARQMSVAYRLMDIDMKCNKENAMLITEFLK